ncbi:arginine/ornithine antiporter ArcD [Vibrio ponticus]|nr:arginine/ornithine antiporter ArcD [Vibrio ponticus]
MRYAIESFDKNGFLLAPKWLWLGWMLLAKAWVVFIVAGVSRDSGSTILNYVYPDHDMLYLGLLMGVPSIALMWLISLRSPERRWSAKIVSWGKPITLITALSQFFQSVYHVYLQAGAFSWTNGVIMLVLLWFAIYVYQSKTVRDCFKLNETN